MTAYDADMVTPGFVITLTLDQRSGLGPASTNRQMG